MNSPLEMIWIANVVPVLKDMKKLIVLPVLLVTWIFGYSQNEPLNLLTGEWYFYNPVEPVVNDTISLSRVKGNILYTKWEFRENGSFIEQDVEELLPEGDAGEMVIIMNSMKGSVWNYNKEELTIELKDLSCKYRIVSNCSDSLVLVRLK